MVCLPLSCRMVFNKTAVGSSKAWKTGIEQEILLRFDIFTV
jgi:hypothetical protein